MAMEPINRLALCFPPRIALVLSHHPRNQCGIYVPPHRVHRCRAEAPIIIQPSLKDWVEFLGNVLQTYLRAFAKFSSLIFCRIALRDIALT